MYIVIEFWTTEQGVTPQTVTYPRETKNEAMSTYHYILHQASVSTHYKYGALVMDDEGRYLARECYAHEPIIEPELEISEEE